MLRIQYIEFLFLLGLLPMLAAIFIAAISRKNTVAKKIGDPILVRQMTFGFSRFRFVMKFILLLTAVTTLILTLTNVRKRTGEEKITRTGIDVMFALDVSRSMLAQDLRPSRLERAKQLVSRLVDRLGDDRIGIVVFAGKAFLQMPLTGDHAATKMYLSAAGPDAVTTQGTVISEAMLACNTSFEARQKKYKAIVLISDGEDHDRNAIKTASNLAAEAVVIHTVGIGSKTGTQLIDPATGDARRDKDGNIIVTRLNEKVLQSIALKSGGKYFFFNDVDEVISGITSQLEGMDKRTVTDDSLVNYHSYFQYFLFITLILMIIELFLSERKPGSRFLLQGSLVFVFICGHCLGSYAQDPALTIKKGNAAYKKGDYTKAASSYSQAMELDASGSTARFNLGNTLFRKNNFEEAIASFEGAGELFSEVSDKSNALYNKGVSLHHLKKIPECIEAYKAALKLNPKNEDARQNLQKALQEQRKAQQQQQPKQQEQQKQEKKQEPKQQRSKLTKQDAENKLKALNQQEKNLQDKLRKMSEVSTSQPEKDW